MPMHLLTDAYESMWDSNTPTLSRKNTSSSSEKVVHRGKSRPNVISTHEPALFFSFNDSLVDAKHLKVNPAYYYPPLSSMQALD
jgi:hypothetical protein